MYKAEKSLSQDLNQIAQKIAGKLNKLPLNGEPIVNVICEYYASDKKTYCYIIGLAAEPLASSI